MPVNRLEKFATEVVNRQDIQGAEYNPRRITPEAQKKLRKELRDIGALQPIVVNRRSVEAGWPADSLMTIVGGHQRIEQMDTVLRKPDYQLTVALIDVDERTEARANIVLNNPAVQGEWDTFKLADLKNEFQFNLDELGFDIEDGLVLFDMTESDPQQIIEAPKEQEEIGEENRAHAKAMRQQSSERIDDYSDDENDYSLVFVFPNTREKHKFCTLVGQPKSATHVKSSVLIDIYRQKYDVTKVS